MILRINAVARLMALSFFLSACGGGGGGSSSFDSSGSGSVSSANCISDFAEGASGWEEYEDSRGSLIVASNQFKVLNRYNFSTDQFQVIAGSDTGKELIDISPSPAGRYIRYATGTSFSTRRDITTVDLTDLQELTTSEISLVRDLTWAPDDQSSTTSFFVFTIFQIGSPVEDRISVQFQDVRVVTWTADGSRALLSGDQKLIVISARTGETLRQMQLSPEDGSVNVGASVLSPDGRKVAYVRETRSDRSVYIWDVATGAESRISSINGNLSWSPSSEYISFDSNEGFITGLKLYTVSTKTLDTLSDANRNVIAFAWAPGKDLLAFSEQGIAQTGGRGKFTLRDYEGQSLGVAAFDLSIIKFEWSPDSRYVAFLSDDANSNRDLLVGDPVNGCVKTLDRVYARGQASSPREFSWSPSGKYLLYPVAEDSGGFRQILVTGDGEQRISIDSLEDSAGPVNFFSPVLWLPTADVLFSSRRSEVDEVVSSGFAWLNINSLTSKTIEIENPVQGGISRPYFWLRP